MSPAGKEKYPQYYEEEKMIVAKLKPESELMPFLLNYSSLLVAGCGGCTSVCYTGGLKETDELARAISRAAKKEKKKITLYTHVVEQQCDTVFFEDIEKYAGEVDAIVSLGCGAGVQLLAEYFPVIPVYPALNTLFTGSSSVPGIFEERCRSCGDCQLAWTGGICPVTRCAKGIFNGPCGGSEQGRCEVNPDVACAWCEIYERLEKQGRLDEMLKVKEPVLWQSSLPGEFRPWERRGGNDK